MNKKSLYIIDDHKIFREGICSLLEKEYIVKGEASNIQEAEKLFIKGENPDLILLDISLGKESGFTLIPRIKELCPESRIILLSMHNKPMFIKKAVELKVDGFVLKESPYSDLSRAIESVCAGTKYLDPACSSHVMDIIEYCVAPAKINRGYNSLSEREQQIFRYLVLRESVVTIAERLFISKKTVENHRSNIYTKLKVNSLIELIKYAEELGVIE